MHLCIHYVAALVSFIHWHWCSSLSTTCVRLQHNGLLSEGRAFCSALLFPTKIVAWPHWEKCIVVWGTKTNLVLFEILWKLDRLHLGLGSFGWCMIFVSGRSEILNSVSASFTKALTSRTQRPFSKCLWNYKVKTLLMRTHSQTHAFEWREQQQALICRRSCSRRTWWTRTGSSMLGLPGGFADGWPSMLNAENER